MDNYLNGFTGIANFKSKGSKFVRNNGYIIINPITGHRLNWYDWKTWKERQESYKTKDWASYRQRKLSNPNNEEAKEVSMHFKAAAKYDRLSLNVVTQGSGIIIMKEAMINFFKYLVDNKLFNIVLLCNIIHDEAVIEYPKEMSNMSKILQKFMEEAAAKYCKSLPIPAVPEEGLFWIH